MITITFGLCRGDGGSVVEITCQGGIKGELDCKKFNKDINHIFISFSVINVYIYHYI